jgi:penicillin-binding protein 2
MARPPIVPHPPDDDVEPPPTREELPFIDGRLRFLLFLFLVAMAAFSWRAYRLTILEGPYHRSESENNFRTETPIVAPRGKIFDRNGLPLAINRRVFDVTMSPFNLSRDEITSTVASLAALLGRPGLIEKTDAVVGCLPKWASVSLAGDLQLEEVLPVIEQGFRFPGVMVQRSYGRAYPGGEAAGNVTGHVGWMTDKQWGKLQSEGYLRQEKPGQLNAELTFESLLHGVNGKEVSFRDARGKPRSSPQVTTQAQPGHALTLTLDLRLQRLADALLGGYQGSIVVMDPRDGEVLAMAQRPSYDPNHPASGSQFNKIYAAGKYPPGSIFKLVTASAGLMAGRSPDEVLECGGFFEFGGMKFHENIPGGYGSEDMYQALQHSCNVFFYTLANRVGASQMIRTAEAYGFGHSTGFELAPPGRETTGVLARVTTDKPFLPGSVVQMGIGQGSMIGVSILQMTRAYAALANGGTFYRPRIVKEIQNSLGEKIDVPGYGKPVVQGRLPLTPTQRAQILEGLRRVVQVEGGTAFKAGFKPEWNVAGKTGTADTGAPGVKPNAWFIGFAPMNAPRVLVAIMVEQAGHGGVVAAPLARQIFAAYFGQPEPQIVPPPLPGAPSGAAAVPSAAD